MRINNFYYNKTARKNNIRLYLPIRQTDSSIRQVGWTELEILIFGLSLNGGGMSSAKLFSRQGAKIAVTDNNLINASKNF